MRLKNKIAIITGGGTGIGLSCARLFCKEGARSVIFGRRADRLDEAVAEIGNTAQAVSGDITRNEDIKRLVETTVNTYGRVDILINNAGVFTGAPVHEMQDSDWDATLNINLTGVFKLTREVLPHMMQQQSGSLIHISSILGLVATPNVAAYNTSKGALNQFSRSLAVEYGSSGIRSNAICPGLIATEMTEELMSNKELMQEWSKNYPIGRFGQPDDIAQACLFLASDESSFVTGTLLPVDGGYTAL
jgi:NAD(P)-dependent dehydrogenase (short-subunit alcohol dehydrogenase family)